MSFNPLSVLFEVPAPTKLNLPLEKHTDFAIVATTSVIGVVTHICFFWLFWGFEVHSMAYFNILSILLFSSVFYFNRRTINSATTLITIACSEVIVHAILAVIIVGWQSGFHFYLLAAMIAIFLTGRLGGISSIILNTVAVSTYMFLVVYTNYNPPIQQVSATAMFTFQMINVGSVSVVVILLTLYYKFVANQISQKLVGANQTLTEQSNKLETFNEELSQQAEELQIQSEQLAHSNRYTTNSIRYALRIQEAVLPSEYALENLFGEKNTMIFYSPKDIVSGDFYWCRETAEGEKILVVADCTGHGVPGAMLMMVGESILSNIVLEKNITEPALILDALQVYFSTLFTSTHNIQDGMDVSISKMNYETKKLYFAGARNPITYIQNQQMKTIQGDKMSIGDSKFKSKIGNKFTPHQIDISIPTMIYMYTDGYQDQFGGKEDKKFYSKNLRNLFFDIHQKPVPEQRKHLKKTFVEWCDITQQTDDVTIVGIKIDTNHKPNAVQELESERIIRKIIEEGK